MHCSVISSEICTAYSMLSLSEDVQQFSSAVNLHVVARLPYCCSTGQHLKVLQNEQQPDCIRKLCYITLRLPHSSWWPNCKIFSSMSCAHGVGWHAGADWSMLNPPRRWSRQERLQLYGKHEISACKPSVWSMAAEILSMPLFLIQVSTTQV